MFKSHKIGVYASVLCELNADDVTFMPRKSRVLCVHFQCGFQKFESEALYSSVNINIP